MTDPDLILVACPHDGALNRVPRARLGQGPKCGKCGQALFHGRPVALDAGGWERHVAKAGVPVLVDFWAGWCGPCLQMAPQFDAAAARLEPRVRLAKLDTEAQPGIAGRYGIQGIPTMILFAGGREVARISGAMSAGDIVRWAEGALQGYCRATYVPPRTSEVVGGVCYHAFAGDAVGGAGDGRGDRIRRELPRLSYPFPREGGGPDSARSVECHAAARLFC